MLPDVSGSSFSPPVQCSDEMEAGFGGFHPAWSHPAPSAPCRPQAGVPSCSPKSVSTHSHSQGRKAGGVTGPGHALAAPKKNPSTRSGMLRALAELSQSSHHFPQNFPQFLHFGLIVSSPGKPCRPSRRQTRSMGPLAEPLGFPHAGVPWGCGWDRCAPSLPPCFVLAGLSLRVLIEG